jgi:hypothetical protein
VDDGLAGVPALTGARAVDPVDGAAADALAVVIDSISPAQLVALGFSEPVLRDGTRTGLILTATIQPEGSHAPASSPPDAAPSIASVTRAALTWTLSGATASSWAA